MEIIINYEEHLEAFPDVKSTEELRKRVGEIQGIENSNVKCIFQLSQDNGLSTEIIISCISLGLNIIQFIYGLYKNRRSNNKNIEIIVNNYKINISDNDSLEQVKLKFEERHVKR